MSITYRLAAPADLETVTDLLFQLFPETPRAELLEETRAGLHDPRMTFFLAFDQDQAVGVAHCAVRSDYVNGTDSSPAGFLEGIFVRPESRRQGIATALVDRCQDWAAAQGCAEFASDALLSNTDSHQFHLHTGFVETERVVYFKRLPRAGRPPA
jgi:aminoglycoside 6'-N-acetyltransferase I